MNLIDSNGNIVDSAETITYSDKQQGWVVGDTVYVDPEKVMSIGGVQLSPLSFKMCFTVSERIAIKALKETDPIIADAFEILDDPRLKVVDLNLQSNQDLIDYLVSLNVLTEERAELVKQGIML